MAAPARAESPGLSRLLRLAGPIVFAQICFFGMNTTDTIVAGRVGAEVLAGVALGGTVMMIGLTFLLGYGLAVSPLVAHLVGARAGARAISRLGRSAVLLLVGLWSLHGLLIFLLASPVLGLLPLEPAVRHEAVAYLRMLALGTPFMGLFFALRNLMEGLGHSRPIMGLGLCALLLNIPLDLALMHGFGPIPTLGAAGCGLATALVQMMLALSLWQMFRRDRRFSAYRPRGRARRAQMGEIMRLGTPIALALASEHALFAAGGLMMTRFGTEALGAAQIALNFTGMMFMIALGMGQATSVLVGQSLGAGDLAGVRHYGRLGYACVGLVSVLIAMLLISFPGQIAGLYTDDAAVAAVALGFIRIAGFFHVVDALQALGSGVLRGLKDTRFVLLATTLAYWLVGGAGFVLCFFVFQAGAQAVWWIYCVALACAALLLAGRFVWQLGQLKSS